MEDSGGGGQDLMSSSSGLMLHLGASFKTEPNDGTATMEVDPSTGFRKRATDEGSMLVSGDARERIAAVKKRILEHKHLRLKSVKEKHAEHVAEWFYLQTGGNLMDYQVWRKKPQTPELINFMRSHRLESSSATSSAAAADDGGNQKNMSSNPAHGTEIKIPGVGATPVAVSTQLPAAVVQLSQLGHVPGRPQGGRHGMVFGQIPVSGTSSATASSVQVPLVPGGYSLVPDSELLATPGTTAIPAKLSGASSAGNVTGLNNRVIGGVILKQQQQRVQSPNVLHVVGPSNLSASFGVNDSAAALLDASSRSFLGSAGESTTGINNGSMSNGNNPDQFSVKAKQEVYVLQRVTELQREGLWPEKRLPKLQEPTRPKAHWDYVLEEMAWLSADFAQERKWKKAAAKKCARMVQKYFQDKAQAAQKAEKSQELQLKRIAAFLAKEIKTFWSSVEKLVEYKQQTRLEEKKKAALDQHLSFIVDQTEKLTEQLTEGMNKPAMGSLNSSRRSSPKPGRSTSDDEFMPGNADSSDDEETIAKEEAESAPDVREEVLALQRESEMDLDDFLKELPKDYLANRDKIVLPESDEDEGGAEEEDKEFVANEDSSDDEDTIREQEKSERIDHKKEIAELEEENEMSIEQLMEKYKNLAKKQGKGVEAMDVDEQPEEEDQEDEDSSAEGNEAAEDTDNSTEVEEDASDDEMKADKDETDECGLKTLMNEASSGDNKDQLIDDAAAIAESIQPKGNTLSSTNVVTEVPFLLKHTLREYQHIGLDWLVTMHDRKLNGILADEMGLGKTIQTIALLAHLACVKGNWGPHLIIVPSSVMLNWEMEFKRWCPGFKILTYYGAQKERKAKRVGWTKVNAFHVCITSYKLVIQDHQSFRRKKWKYLILDEAQNIKNFKSQRWQLLLNFSSEQRLLLTGTPLQNNLMELWSLMHFLMPHVFQSHREFKEWFSNPMTGMIEGNSEYNESIVKRLHKVLRPFLLRRLKSEVEKQMPKKYEHVVMCRLSKRQRYLYEDFMSRAKTRETLASGNLLSVINVLMQLRKVCNHPNLFEVRPTISPFRMEGIRFKTASLVTDLFRYNPMKDVDLQALNLDLLQLELSTTAYMAYRCKKLSTPKRLIEEVDEAPRLPPSCPSGRFRMHIKVKPDAELYSQKQPLSSNARFGQVRAGTSPAMKVEGNRFILVGNPPPSTAVVDANRRRQSDTLTVATATSLGQAAITTGQVTTSGMLVKAPNGRHYLIPASSMPSAGGTTTHVLTTQNGQRLAVVSKNSVDGSKMQLGPAGTLIKQPMVKLSPIQMQPQHGPSMQPLAAAVAQQLRTYTMNQAKPAPAVVEKLEAPTDMDVDLDESDLDLKEFVVPETEVAKREHRLNQLRNLSRFNEKHCDANPIYGEDLRSCLINLYRSESKTERPWTHASYENCVRAVLDRTRCEANWLMHLLKSVEERTQELKPVFENFVTFVPSVSSPAPQLHVSHPDPSTALREQRLEVSLREDMSPRLRLLHPITSAMSTQFPDPRLIQYDCGKLQTLDKLLRRLKCGGHKVLIFTQMTRMLDVLEAFLNVHGHIYLRLDGTTKVEQRQVLMERFNSDKRIFAFILSTRSGGVGVNLTGADTVIFYDSDWNPTMDAQAQDRCHRIGQTRDVHIYRLVSEKTIEENILKKANQKRLLGDLAIEGGNFTTAYFKSSTIQDLFQVDNRNASSDVRMQELLELDKARRTRLNEAINAPSTSQAAAAAAPDAAFASALQAAEDEQDVEAAKTAQAEVDQELAEFDENIPIEEDTANKAPEMSKAEQEVENLVKQLSPIERYAMKFVEETGGQWAADKLRMAEADFEQQKREWEANRQAAQQKAEEEEQLQKQMDEDDYPLTYSSEDAKNQIWISENTGEQMPMWCPPTPPQDDNDIYTDHSLAFLYEPEVMSESQLPPVYVRKEYKRSRMDAGLYADGNKRTFKLRKEDLYHPPKSLFDRPSPALSKIRRDLKLQRYRGTLKSVHLPSLGLSSSSMALLKPNQLQKPLLEPEGMSDWYIYEDMAMLNVIQNLQGLPLNLMVLSPGHTVNWDLVADIVNQSSRTYRSPKQCRYRYEAVVVPREEGKLIETPKKQKKNKPLKNPMKNGGGSRCLRTSQVFGNDNNTSFTKLLRLKIETMKNSYGKKQMPIRHRYVAAIATTSSSTTTVKNPKHVEVLTEHGIFNYDSPVTPADIAQRRIDRITKEKQKQLGTTPVQEAAPLTSISQQSMPVMAHQMQQQPQLKAPPPQMAEVTVPLLQQPQTQVQNNPASQTVLIQQHPQSTGTAGNIALVQTTSPMQTIRHASGIQLTQQSAQQQQQIMKAIVTSSSVAQQNLLAGQVQQITMQQQNPGQQGGGSSGPNSVVVPSSVSVVLSTAGSVGQQSQIVSIQQTGATSTITTQSVGGGSIVHTLSSASGVTGVTPKMTVQQLAQQISGGTLQTNAIPASTLRAQRIVQGGLQEVVLHQRGGTNQNPTVVSVSNLGQGLTQAQLQTQLRLQMAAGGQQVSGVVAKGISVAAAAAAAAAGANKPGGTQQLQFYRQQPIRQQLKVLHTTTSTAQGQTTTAVQQGQTTTLVNPSGTIFQGGIVQTAGGALAHQTVQVQQTASGQKVAVVSGTNTAGVATVQVAGSGRTQFIKQIGPGKQTIARPVTEGEMQTLVVKRQFISQQQQQGQGQPAVAGQHKTQVLSQAQIYAPATMQVQTAVSNAPGTSVVVSQGGQATAGTSAAGQISATLVKTTGTVAGGSPTAMTFSQVKAGQIKATMANANQVRQLQMQQMYAQRKAVAAAAAAGKSPSMPQLPAKAGIPTQLIVNSKNLPVAMQQFQVIRHAQPGTLATAGLVLSKNMGRMIPASSSQPNSRPTIQVVTATSSAGQALSAGNLRATHVTSSNLAGTLQGTIKVSNASAAVGAGGQAGASSASVAQQQQQQQALITALQNQNVSPVRLQTSGGSLVAVAVQQSPTMVSNHGQSLEIVHQQQQQQQQQGGGGGSSVQQNQNQ